MWKCRIIYFILVFQQTDSRCLSGPQGPALFTLMNANGFATLGSNTITTDSTAGVTTDIVKTIETYSTAFHTFRIGSIGTINDPFLIGLVNTQNIHTFAFAFQFNSVGALFTVANQGGSISAGTYNIGDIFSVAVTDSQYQLYQNGVSVATGTNTLGTTGSYYANFFLANPDIYIDLISFGYLSAGATGPVGPTGPVGLVSSTVNSQSISTTELINTGIQIQSGVILANTSGIVLTTGQAALTSYYSETILPGNAIWCSLAITGSGASSPSFTIKAERIGKMAKLCFDTASFGIGSGIFDSLHLCTDGQCSFGRCNTFFSMPNHFIPFSSDSNFILSTMIVYDGESLSSIGLGALKYSDEMTATLVGSNFSTNTVGTPSQCIFYSI